MNRIAWLGQAAVCYATGVPATFAGGFYLLNGEQQDKANNIALEYLNEWLIKNGLKQISLEDAISVGRQVNIY
jgi:hypothetical protein